MSDFSLRLESEPLKRDGVVYHEGRIKIGSFTELLRCPVGYWKRQDYVDQWLHALRQVCQDGQKTALIVSMYDPRLSNFVMIWPLYLVDRVVYIRNGVIFLDDIGEIFDPAEVGRYLEDRATPSETEERVSEWCVSREAVEDALSRGIGS